MLTLGVKSAAVGGQAMIAYPLTYKPTEKKGQEPEIGHLSRTYSGGEDGNYPTDEEIREELFFFHQACRGTMS